MLSPPRKNVDDFSADIYFINNEGGSVMKKAKTDRSRAQLTVLILAAMILFGAPARGIAAVDPACNATINGTDLILHIPVISYLDKLYSLDLKYVGNAGPSNELLGFIIAGARETTQNCAAQSQLFQAQQMTLNIASLVIGSEKYDASLELVSTRQLSAAEAATATAGTSPGKRMAADAGAPVFDFRVKSVTPLRGVWKGNSRCHKTYIDHGFNISEWAIGVASFGRLESAPDGEYELLEGMVTYRSSQFSDMGPQAWERITVDNITVPMKNGSLSSYPSILNISNLDPKYYSGQGLELMPELTGNVVACCDVNGGTYSYTTPVTAGSMAEWLKISPEKFTRSDAETISGSETTTVPPFNWECSWFFVYYP